MNGSAPPRRKTASLRERLLSTETLAVLLVAALATIATNAVSSLVRFRAWVAAIGVLYLLVRWAFPALRGLAGVFPRFRRAIVIVAFIGVWIVGGATVANWSKRKTAGNPDGAYLATFVADSLRSCSPSSIGSQIEQELRFKWAMRFRIGPEWIQEATPRARQIAERISDNADLEPLALRHAAYGEGDDVSRLLAIARTERGFADPRVARLEGDAYFYGGRCTEAIASYQKARGLAPNDLGVRIDAETVMLVCAPDQADCETIALTPGLAEKTRGPKAVETAMALDNLAECWSRREPRRSIPFRLRAVEIYEKALTPTHIAVAGSVARLGATYMQLGLAEDALKQLTRAVAIREARVRAGHAILAANYWEIGLAERALGRNDKAEEHIRLARLMDARVDRKELSPAEASAPKKVRNLSRETTASTKMDVVRQAQELMRAKRYAEAEVLLREEIHRLRYASSPDSNAVTSVWWALQEVYRRMGKREEEYQDVAREARRVSLDAQLRKLEANIARPSMNDVSEYLRLADGYAGDEEDGEAVRLYLKAIDLHGTIAGPYSCDLIRTLERYYQFLNVRDREAEAAFVVQRIRSIRETCRANSPQTRRRGW